MNELYEFAVSNGYEGSAEDFAKECAGSYSGGNNDLYAVNRGLLSSVSVYSYVTTSKRDMYTGQVKESTDLFASGSGVIIDINKETGDAYIITNFHVIYYSERLSGKTADKVEIFLYGMEYSEQAIEATYVGGSVQYDIAILKVAGSDILKTSPAVAAQVADSNAIVPGLDAIAIGNPASGGISATSGIVSVVSENINLSIIDGYSYNYRVMRIDAAVNSGNSGGGLFNAKGELIGIVNAKISYNNIENIGYAIPSNVALNIAHNIIDTEADTGYKGARRYLLGITLGSLDSKLAYDEATDTTIIEETVGVQSIESNSPAKGKLEPGDVLKYIRINDGDIQKITRSYIITDVMLAARSGDIVTITIERDGKLHDIRFDLSEITPTEVP